MKNRSRHVAAIVLLFATIAGACGGSSAVSLTAIASKIELIPKNNGFSFSNFGAEATDEVFNTKDLVAMFGASACVDKNETNCAPTAQAGQWAQMVNDARISGHCEGLAVQSSERFNKKATPQTVDLKNEGDVTHGIMRAFATQFLPEVQDATNEWSKKSIVEIVNELSASFTEGASTYTLGLYTENGGHAVLPYALEFPNKDLAVIKVYDSNWPGKDRYVVVDLKAKQWFFSFSGTDPQKDECAWTGGEGQIDITPLDVRTAATCPFCGDDSKVTKSVLFIRSTTDKWSVQTKNGTYSPSEPATVDGVSSRAIRSATCKTVVRLPEFVLSADTPDIELTLPDTAAVYVSNANSVVKIVTSGSKKRKPIVISKQSIAIADPSAVVTVAVDNVIAQVTSDNAQIALQENSIEITVDGAPKPIEVSASNPQVVVNDTTSAPPVIQTVTNLVTLTPTVIPELVPDAVKPGLTPIVERDLSNAVYAQEVLTAPSTTVPISVPPVTTTTSTTTTTVKATTTSTTLKTTTATVVGTGETSSSTTTTATQTGGGASTLAPTGPTSTSSTLYTPTGPSGNSTTTTTTTNAPQATALSCTFVVNGYGVQGFECSDGSQRGWTGKLHRFPGDEYVFTLQPGWGYQYGNYTIQYNVTSIPSGFSAQGTYIGIGCDPAGCY